MNPCIECGDPLPPPRKVLGKDNRTRTYSRRKFCSDRCAVSWWQNGHGAQMKATERIRLVAMKRAVIQAYGGCCACCGETIEEFLTIDHVQGDGAADRAKGWGGKRLSERVWKEGCPAIYRILCMNCNWAIGVFKYCPHQKDLTVTDSAPNVSVRSEKCQSQRRPFLR